MKVNILGTDYTIVYKDYTADSYFEKYRYAGYCDEVTKTIVVGNLKTFPNMEDETSAYCKESEKYTLRHELIHAFLNESGLSTSSTVVDRPWAKNEEMIDFFAIQIPKIVKTFEKLKLL